MNNSYDIEEVLKVISQILIRCVVIGILVLFVWWGALALLGDLAYSVHSKIVPMTRGQFDIIQYTGMLATKAVVSLLFFFPYIAIRLVIKKRAKK